MAVNSIIKLEEDLAVEGGFRLVRLLGKGAMAEVWEAEQQTIGERVAIKIVAEQLELDLQARRRFQREVMACKCIDHPNVVQMLGHGEVADGRPFMIMELVRGQTLGQYLKQNPAPSFRTVLMLAEQLLEALEAAHAEGVVHRDIKPANIMLARPGAGELQVKVLDFGVARIIGYIDPEGRLTRSDATIGSPHYMPIELARGNLKDDPRSDIFGVGAVMYAAFTGHPPWRGEEMQDLVGKMSRHDIPPLGPLRPDLPPAVVECVERALGPNPGDRHASAAAMRQDVAALLAEPARPAASTSQGIGKARAETVGLDPAEEAPAPNSPVEIRESLARFRQEHPDPMKIGFLMMRFGAERAHAELQEAIQFALRPFGLTILRADHREYHEDLYYNVLTYMHGCGFGVAVFDHISTDEINPNVSFETGFMAALGKRVLLLKDRALPTLQADLAGKLYRDFDPLDPMGTVPRALTKWLVDREIVPVWLNAELVQTVMENLLPNIRSEEPEDFAALSTDLERAGVVSPDQLVELIVKYAQVISEHGAVYSHSGLVRWVLEVEHGEDFRERLEIVPEARFDIADAPPTQPAPPPRRWDEE